MERKGPAEEDEIPRCEWAWGALDGLRKASPTALKVRRPVDFLSGPPEACLMGDRWISFVRFLGRFRSFVMVSPPCIICLRRISTVIHGFGG